MVTRPKNQGVDALIGTSDFVFYSIAGTSGFFYGEATGSKAFIDKKTWRNIMLSGKMMPTQSVLLFQYQSEAGILH